MSDDNDTKPELTGGQIAKQVETELGIDHDEFVRRTKEARWPLSRWQREIQEPGWPERFEAACREAREKRERDVTRRVRTALRYGPIALADMPMEQLLARVDERLHPLALTLKLEDGGRLITGPTGIGKSTALVAVFRRIEQERPDADPYGDPVMLLESSLCRAGLMWVRAGDLPVARLAHRLGDGEADLVTDAKNARTLVVDDLGWESSRANAADVVLEVIAHRYDTGAPTWVSSGQRPDELIARYGDSIVRRICETGGKPGKVINLWGGKGK